MGSPILKSMLAAFLLAAPTILDAATLDRTELNFKGRAYHYLFSAHLRANPAAVRAIVSDIDRLARLNDDIVTSQILSRESEQKCNASIISGG